jgi:hypothetical protein
MANTPTVFLGPRSVMGSLAAAARIFWRSISRDEHHRWEIVVAWKIARCVYFVGRQTKSDGRWAMRWAKARAIITDTEKETDDG